MGKNTILAISVIALLLPIVYNSVSLPLGTKSMLLVILIIAWIATTFAVFMDSKKRNEPTIYAALSLFLGGLGGLIYYFQIYKEKESTIEIKPSAISETSRKNLLIFSSVLAVIFGLALIMTLPFYEGSSLNLPLTGTWGILFLLSIISIFYARAKH